MPVRELSPSIVRLVECLSGSVDMRMDLEIRFAYGSVVPWVRRIDGQLVAIAGPDGLALWTTAETRGEEMRTVSEFHLREGQQVPFVLTYFPSHEEVARPVAAQYAIEETTRWWQDWADLANFQPHQWRDAVVRSLITLKALTYEPSGGILAAPTTSLPETHRRRAQLGLPLLLAARRHPDAVGAHGRGLPGGGRRLARLAAAGRRWRPLRAADHVRRGRGEEPQRRRHRMAARAMSTRPRSASATPPRASTSWTSTGRCSAPCTRPVARASSRQGRPGISSSP